MEAMGQNLLMNMIIRPPRNTYPDDSYENNKVITVAGKNVVKKVFTLQNAKGEKLSCSFYEPEVRPSP